MHPTLEYLDKRVDTAVLERESTVSTIPDNKRKEIKAKATRSVAGFRVADEELERKLLDDQIKAQRAALDKFIFDRKVMRETLDKVGISPLTILPKQAWDNICKETHLFRLTPDANGRVGIAKGWNEGRCEGYNQPISRWSESTFDWAQSEPMTWRSLLYKMWPTGLAASNKSLRANMYNALAQEVTIMLPTPPDDVVDILLKADKGKIPMKVAAVAEAIGFKENLVALRDGAVKHYADEAARIKRLLEEPFIYSEHETATAILAQFGEFPIEKAVVDAVVAAKDFIPETITPTSAVQYEPDPLAQAIGQAQLRQLMGAQYAHQDLLGQSAVSAATSTSVPYNSGLRW